MSHKSMAVCGATLLAFIGCKTTEKSQVKDTFFSPVLSSLSPTVTIANAHQVDDRVYRGMLPVAYDQLKNQLLKHNDDHGQLVNNLQITDMLIIDSRYNDNIDFEMDTLAKNLGVVPAFDYGPNSPASDWTPAFVAQVQAFRQQPWDVAVKSETEAPLRYFYRSLMWDNLAPFDRNCSEYLDALRVLQHIRKSPERRVYFHCTVGEDRTGAVAGLYDLLSNQDAAIADVFHNEMCERGYEAGNPSKGMAVVNKIRANLTPFFLKMAYKVKTGELSWDHLDYAVCATDPAGNPQFSGDKTYAAENYQCEASSQAKLKPRD